MSYEINYPRHLYGKTLLLYYVLFRGMMGHANRYTDEVDHILFEKLVIK